MGEGVGKTEAQLASQRRYYAKNRDRLNAQQRDRARVRRAGMAEAHAEAMLRQKAATAARYRCEGCGGRKTRLTVDRCHSCHSAIRARQKSERAAWLAAERVNRPALAPSPRRTAEEQLVAMRAWRAAHPGYMAAWRARNPEKRRAARKARKSTRRENLRASLSTAQRGRCAYCRERLGEDSHIDHIVAVARGGSNRRSNLQLACADCNMRKGAKDQIVFAQSMGMLV